MTGIEDRAWGGGERGGQENNGIRKYPNRRRVKVSEKNERRGLDEGREDVDNELS